MLTVRETEIMRELARSYMEYALAPRQTELQKLWIAHNTGRSERPMVLIDQIPWHEMDVDGSLVCQIEDPYWRGVECSLRRSLYKARYMPADMLLTPYILIPRILKHPDYRSYGIQIQESISRTDQVNDVVSHAYIKQFETMEDLEKIRPIPLSADTEKEAIVWEEAERIFSGIAPVRWQGVSIHSGLWDTISMWQGVEECYYMLLDEPELLHAIMDRMTQIALDWIRTGNEEGLFDTTGITCHCSHTLMQPFGTGAEDRPGLSQNSWTYGMAQLFTSVSPDVTREFEIPYVSRIFEHFGNVYYGCCEKLDDRLDIISKLPNVRKVSCSPWSDVERFASQLPQNLILSNKPNPALTGSGDLEAARRELGNTIQAARRHNVRLEMILKDNSTVHYHPERLWEFSKMALELVQN